MEMMGIAGVAGITVICYLIAELVKQTPLANKWVPSICGLCGAAFGVFGMCFIPDFPAGDIITALAVGIVSGLAATGGYEAVKQLTGKKE